MQVFHFNTTTNIQIRCQIQKDTTAKSLVEKYQISENTVLNMKANNLFSEQGRSLLFILLLFLLSDKVIAQCKINPSTNMVVNSAFNTSISNWTLMTGMSSCTVTPTSIISHDNGALKINVNNNYQLPCPTPFNWRTYVLGGMSGTLVQGQPYVFTFKARTNSSVPLTFDAAVRLTTTQWQIAFQNQQINVINQWQEFCTIQLHSASSVSNIEVAFFFGLVPDGTEIWIDDVYVGTPAGFVENHKIRVNQMGYQINYPKEGISVDSCGSFVIKNAATNSVVYSGNCSKLGKYPYNQPMVCNYQLDTIWRLSFNALNTPGDYYIEADNGHTSYTFSINNNIYDSLRKDAFRFFYFQRCGQALPPNHWYNLSRPACHSQDGNALVVDTSFSPIGNKDVSGGWHDAGDYVKYTFNNALSTVFLAKAYLENPLAFSDNEQIPESGNGVPDIVDELALNAAFLFKMQDTAANSPEFGGVHSKVSTQSWNVYTMPQNENNPRYLTPPTTISTAGFVAAMCYLYRVFNTVPTYQYLAAPCSTAAFRGWSYLNTHNQLALDQVNNPLGPHINTATYDQYPDIDERVWAAAEMYRTFQDNSAHTYFLNNYIYCNNVLLGDPNYSHYLTGSACPSMQYHHQSAWIGFLSYLDAPNPDMSVISTLNNWLMSHADSIVSKTNSDYFSFNLRTWGNNYALLNNSMVLKKAFDVSSSIIYKNAMVKNLDYILGKNITDYSFITGYGSRTPVNLNHLHTKNDAYIDVPKGAMVGGPIGNSVTPPTLPVTYNPYNVISLYFDTCAAHAKRYLDVSYGAYSNEPTIDYNARLVYTLYALLPTLNTSVMDLSHLPSAMYVYPNPSNGKFIIGMKHNSLSTNFRVLIYNVYGQIVYVYVGKQINFPFEIDLSSQPNGVYFIKLEIGKEIFSHKIILQQ